MKKLLYLLRWAIGPISRPMAGLFTRLAAQLGGEHARRRRRAQRLATQLVAELSRLGFSRKIVTGGQKRRRVRRQRVEFEQPLILTADELWCPLNLAKLPTGVRTDDLRDEAVVRSLEDRTDCSVRLDYLANGKLCFVVRHGGATFPEKFTVNAVSWPEEAGALAVPAGVNADGEQVIIDLGDLVHLLIAGATNGGKTTFQHVMITSLINRNTADDLELWLIDLKRTEFNLYRPLVNKKGDGIVKSIAVEPEEAIDTLDRALREITRRNQLMEQHHATSLADLASSTGVRLRRIVLIIDEFAQLTLNTSKLGKQSIGKIAENLITRIAALGRSAGFSIVIATQMVQREVISGLIQANFENRIAFSVANWRQSQMIVESSDADGIPAGRAVLRVKGQTKMVQTALITSRQVRIEVDRVAQFGPDGAWGEDLELARFVKDAKLIISVACQHFEGAMARAKVLDLDGIKGVISWDRFNEVCQRLERDGVLESGGPRKPRRVSKGFFGRPGLIDNLYGLSTGDEPPPTESPTEDPTVTPRNDNGGTDNDTVGSHQEAPHGRRDSADDTVYGVGISPTHGAAPDPPDPAPPSWWAAIEPAPPPPPPPPNPRKRRVTQRRRKG
jgi:hypothetical protein